MECWLFRELRLAEQQGKVSRRASLEKERMALGREGEGEGEGEGSDLQQHET